ncbi:uncharacterized protein LOC132687086 [Panthera onca]
MAPMLKNYCRSGHLVKDAEKIAMGQELYATSPHAIEGVLKQPPDCWISNARLPHYQSLLLNLTRILFKPPTTLNPATLLPNSDWDPPLHNCQEILAQVHGIRADLRDQPLPNADATWYMDGSSFVREGIRYAGAAVTTEMEIIWAEPLAAGTSAQRAKLIALAEALTMGEGKRINIYTDSRYAFATTHIHRALYRERGLLTAEAKTIKNETEILELLRALWLPKALAIIHCPGHQKADTPVARGNRLADSKAKEAALSVTQVLTTTLPDPGALTLPDTPNYTGTDLKWIKRLPMTQCLHGWWRAADSSIILPEELGRQVLSKMHRSTPMGTRKMEDLIRHAKIIIKDSRAKIKQTVASCHACRLTNATTHGSNPRTQLRGDRPGIYWEVDFTEVRPGKYGYKYLLVFVDTFSGWTEAFPTKHETAQIVTKKLLEDILPRYGFPARIGSDNGPGFISKSP